MSLLADPVYPERNTWRGGDRPEALRHLQDWVRGRESFHPYGQRPQDHDDYDRDVAPSLEYRGKLGDLGGMYWVVSYQRVGVREDNGFSSGHMHPADAAYSCLVYIEQHEREVYENSLVLGFA